jgi:hypothetical protein
LYRVPEGPESTLGEWRVGGEERVGSGSVQAL